MAKKQTAKSRIKLGTFFKSKLKNTIMYMGYKWVLPLAYKWYCHKAGEMELVLFIDHRRSNIPDNFIPLIKMCVAKGYKCEVLNGSTFSDSIPKWQRRKAKVQFHFRFMKLLAQCKVLFLDDWFPLIDIVKPRKGTQVVQLWHGCGIFKKWGYAVTSGKWGKSEKIQRVYPDYLHQTLSTVSSDSKRVMEGYRAAFNCDISIIKPFGCPCTDIYFDESFRKSARRKIQSLFSAIGQRKVILYAPTFRGNSIKNANLHVDLDFKYLNDSLCNKYCIVTKFHPLMSRGGLTESNRLKGYNFVFDATTLLTAEEAVCAADILITDYSSIMFEFMLMERPIISFIFDIDKYISDRGLFYPYDQLAPGPYVFTQEELAEKLLTVDEWFDIERIRAYKKEFMSACDGHSTERIFNYVFRENETEGKITI